MAENTDFINNTNLTTWTINDTEVAYYCISPWGSSSGTLPLYIPKLMPNIGMGRPKTTRVSINKGCFCNASECKPNVGTSLTAQNYISVSPQDNRTYKLPNFRYGATIQVEVHNGNVDKLFLTTKVDNSCIAP